MVGYRNCVYSPRARSCVLFTWDEEGNRTRLDCSFAPYLYIEDPNGSHTSIFKTKLRRKSFETQYDRSKFVKNSGIKRLFYNYNCTQQFLIDTYWEHNETDDFSKYPLKIVYLDIETCSSLINEEDVEYDEDGEEIDARGFPKVTEANHEINVITCYDTLSKKFHTFGSKPYTNKNKDVIYYYCKDETELLQKFLKYWSDDYPDIVTAHNGEFFDFPYIANRITRILGEDYTKELSPVGNVYFRQIFGQFGQTQQRLCIDGVSLLDYLDVYKRFILQPRESYRLDSIAEIELGENKLDFGDQNLFALAKNDWDKFVDYNIQDVNLLVKLEAKLQFLGLVRMLAYIGCTTFESAMGSISVIGGALAINAKQKNLVTHTFIRGDGSGTNPGAYVADPKQGINKNIVSFDANSLYPNVMITLNISSETKIGKIIETTPDQVKIKHVSGKIYNLSKPDFASFIKAEKIAIAKSNVLFSQKEKGIAAEVVDYYYKQRVKVRDQLSQAKKALSKTKSTENANIVDRLNARQLSIKILINSVYGSYGNKAAPHGDDDIASSITLTGQAVIKQANIIANEFVYKKTQKSTDAFVYGDTDSLYLSLDALFSDKPFHHAGIIPEENHSLIKELEQYLNQGITRWARSSLLTFDPRFVFKRESIADVGCFLAKKRYILHVIDDEGIACSKYKYVGVDVVRTQMPGALKPYAKKIIETILSTQDYAQSNKVLEEAYNVFKTLPPEDIATVMGVKNYDKYASQCNKLSTVKRMPKHVKSAYFYNYFLDELGITDQEKIQSGDKVRFMEIEPNRFQLATIGFKYKYPDKIAELFKPNYDAIFDKILYAAIKRVYDAIGWQCRKPQDNIVTDLFDLFG